MQIFGNQQSKAIACLLNMLILADFALVVSPASAATKHIKEEGEIRVDIKVAPKPPAAQTAAPKAESAIAPTSPASGEAKPAVTGVAADPSSQSTNSEARPEVKVEPKLEPKSEPRPEVKAEALPPSYSVAYDIRPLKGKMDKIPVLNSNSPEIIPAGGILLSTLDPDGMKHPSAHLNYPVKGQFGIFFHHINKQEERAERKVLTISMLVYNPGSSKASLTFKSLASYVSQPDAPVYTLPAVESDDQGNKYAGQGDRVVSDYVRSAAVLETPLVVTVPPRTYALLADLPIKVYGAVSTLNGRTYYALGQTNKPLQFALFASFSPASKEEISEAWHPEGVLANITALRNEGTGGGDTSISNRLAELIKLVEESELSGPREGDKRAPTPPHSKEAIVYGRVSGVQLGTRYQASHAIPIEPGKELAIAYPISSVEQGTMGTGEVQTAPLVKRYENSAYAAHGNYCVHYSVDLKLVNKCKRMRYVDLALSSPLKTDKPEKSLTYFKEQDRRVFFRGVIKVIEAESKNKIGKGAAHYYHLVGHRGEKLPPFSRLEMEPGATKFVRIELYYTPDATPPQMLTIDSTAQ
jgi:Protein of unknown function (DUF3370)